jgi:hypothetical protein
LARHSPEATLQAHITSVLRTLGYTLMETGKSRSAVRCPHCKGRHYATGWQGNTVGLPDLYIHREGWPAGTALAMELKTPKGAVRPEQQALADAGCTVIVRTFSDALRWVRSFEERLGNVSQATRLDQMINSDWIGDIS